MRLLFEQKKPGRVKQSIQPVAIDIEERPTTVGELIAATVKACVGAYNLKAAKAPENPDDDQRHHLVMDEKTINELAETGRVSFGIVYNGRMVDADEAVANALQCYEDGLFRIFLNSKPLKEADNLIEVNENDLLTVVRLTFLAGRLW
ncbi:MAG: hypothetical protein K2H60_06545 [Muribaculaceae bacterium]|nr:hypothetical protein [Muribaculaceae bacterium]